MALERLQKVLAKAGYGSRRKCEALISSGRVHVNGQVAVIGIKVDQRKDQITIDRRPIKPAESLVYVVLYKPRGVLSTVNSNDLRPNVLNLIDVPGRVYPVGRLDIESEGLMLLTNDGELANKLTHPRYGHEKEYRVLVARHPDEQQLGAWRRGVVLSDGKRTSPAKVWVESQAGKGSWLRVVMREGRKRQIRETGRQIGLPVAKIIRVRIANLELGNLKPRQWRYLSPEEIAGLKSKSGSPKSPR